MAPTQLKTALTSWRGQGGPVLGFCAGRIDDVDGSASEALGPTALQVRAGRRPIALYATLYHT